MSGKIFGNYQMLLKLFEDLRDGDINPKEILEDQSDLSEIKMVGKKLINQKKYNNFTNLFITLLTFLIYKKKLLIFLDVIIFAI